MAAIAVMLDNLADSPPMLRAIHLGASVVAFVLSWTLTQIFCGIH